MNSPDALALGVAVFVKNRTQFDGDEVRSAHLGDHERFLALRLSRLSFKVKRGERSCRTRAIGTETT